MPDTTAPPRRSAVVATPPSAPTRAPALYFVGVLPPAAGGTPFSFRLPCPPVWDDRAPSAWAAERRARRAYFATLDALRTGRVDEEEDRKARRLLGDLRSATARGAVTHFLRVFDMVRRGGGEAIVPTPPAPLPELVVTAPPVGIMAPEALAARYRWAFEWLDARRFVVGRGLRVEWQVRRITPQGIVVVPADPAVAAVAGARLARTTGQLAAS
jgi:hypothetical protein